MVLYAHAITISIWFDVDLVNSLTKVMSLVMKITNKNCGKI